MLYCETCGRKLERLESEFNGKPVHDYCLDVAIIKAALERMQFVPLDMPEWMKDFARKFKGWSRYTYG